MQAYIVDRLVTAGLLGVLLLGAFVYAPNESFDRWYVLLFVLTIFAYSHIIAGFYYQVRAVQKRSTVRVELLTLFAVIAVSLGVAMWFVVNAYTAALSFLVLIYFMWHGYTNEITLFERQTQTAANRGIIFSVAIGFLGLIVLAVGHASWFFDVQFVFQPKSTEVLTKYLNDGIIPLVARFIGTACIAGAVIVSGYAALRATRSRWPLIGLTIFWLSAVPFVFVFYPLHYITLLASLLIYHFLVWFLFFLRVFWRDQPQRLVSYVCIHALVVLPFASLLLPENQLGLWVEMYALNLNTLLTMTLLHVSTSFLNEPVVRRWFGW